MKNKTLAELRQDSDKLVASLKARRKEIDNDIAQRVLNNGTIYRAQIAEIQPGIPFVAIPGILAKRIPTEDPDQILIYNEIGANIQVDPHDHDCPERITPVHGPLKVNDRTLKPGDSVLVPAGELHLIRSPKGGAFINEFLKIEKPLTDR